MYSWNYVVDVVVVGKNKLEAKIW